MADAKDESFSTSEEDVEALKKKGYCWTRDETLLLISLYQQNQELFKNVNYKKKQVWELIASLTLVRGGFRGGGGAEGAAAPSFSSSEIYFFVKIYNNFIIL